jgi:hypothetical protein
MITFDLFSAALRGGLAIHAMHIMGEFGLSGPNIFFQVEERCS